MKSKLYMWLIVVFLLDIIFLRELIFPLGNIFDTLIPRQRILNLNQNQGVYKIRFGM